MPENPQTPTGSQDPKSQQPGQFKPGSTMYHRDKGEKKPQDQAEHDKLLREGWTDQPQ